MKRKPLFLSLAPNLVNESGHGVVYQKCLESAAKQLGFSYFGLLPQETHLQRRQKNWIPFFRRHRIGKWADFFRLFLIKREKIFFIESFNTSEFIYLALSSLFFSHKTGLICVLFRYGLSQLRYRGAIHLWMVRLCKARWGNRFLMFTDSELIAEEYGRRLKTAVQVLPIPHVDREQRFPSKKRDKILCWWPGEPREAKGLQEVSRLALWLGREGRPLELVAAEKSGLPNATLIPDILSREEYLFWLHEATCILLPYDPTVYRYGTSGIFVEAVVAGKIPLVKKGSWLAHELMRYDLGELILDWENPPISLVIEKLVFDPFIQENLKKMQAGYSSFHSQKVFTETLRVLDFRDRKRF